MGLLYLYFTLLTLLYLLYLLTLLKFNVYGSVHRNNLVCNSN